MASNTRTTEESGTDDEHTHYCFDCELKLALMYDDRDDKDIDVVCGHCGGTNTQPLTMEYGVRVRGHFTGFGETARYWTPEPSSAEDALDVVAEHVEEDREMEEVVTTSAEDVKSRAVPAPEGWFDGE